jgi:hypothetical protein
MRIAQAKRERVTTRLAMSQALLLAVEFGGAKLSGLDVSPLLQEEL